MTHILCLGPRGEKPTPVGHLFIHLFWGSSQGSYFSTATVPFPPFVHVPTWCCFLFHSCAVSPVLTGENQASHLSRTSSLAFHGGLRRLHGTLGPDRHLQIRSSELCTLSDVRIVHRNHHHVSTLHGCHCPGSPPSQAPSSGAPYPLHPPSLGSHSLDLTLSSHSTTHAPFSPEPKAILYAN